MDSDECEDIMGDNGDMDSTQPTPGTDLIENLEEDRDENIDELIADLARVDPAEAPEIAARITKKLGVALDGEDH